MNLHEEIKMTHKADLSDIRAKILSLEKIYFNSSEPVALDKLDIDAETYDFKYEKKVRKKEFSHLALLNELFLFKTGEPAESYGIYEEVEEQLFSPQFYREFIFGNGNKAYTAPLHEFAEGLGRDLKFVKDNISEKDYTASMKMVCPEACPDTLKQMIEETDAYIQTLRRELATLN